MNDARAEGWADHGKCKWCDQPVVLEDAYWADDLPFCSEDCADLWMTRDECSSLWEDEEDYLIDGVGFADPGGHSALRAATPSNPRNLPCPTCGRPNMLTPIDRQRGYQCDICADAAERGLEY